LVSIETREEFHALKEYLLANNLKYPYWTSGNELIRNNDWRWLGSGIRLRDEFWGPGEPNHIDESEHCVQLKYRNNNFEFNDKNCYGRFGFICEKDNQ